MILICPTHEVVKQIVEEIQQESLSIQVLDVQQLTMLTEFFIIIVSEDEKQTQQIATKINKVFCNCSAANLSKNKISFIRKCFS